MEIHKIVCDNCKEQEKDLKNPSFGDLRKWQYLNDNLHFCSIKCLIEYFYENKGKLNENTF